VIFRPSACLLFAAVFSAGSSLRAQELPEQDIRDSIVKIYTIHNRPDYYNPWSMQGTRSSTGSGCVIKGKKILTNAHVVSDQTFVQVRRHGEFKRYQARVESVSHDADLALLTVDDPGFFDGVGELTFGDLPGNQDEVLVYGFPLGGDTLSTTKGVISRIEHQTYAHSSVYLLAGQIDAAINPGNSGGPVIQDGQICGVVMQAISGGENLGYMVPVNIVQHFLSDLEDGSYDGFPSMGVILQAMENPEHRKKMGMENGDSGVMIIKILLDSPAAEVLKENDVILSIDGENVAYDGTVEYRLKDRTSVSYLIQRKQLGESVDLEVLRNGSKTNLTLALNRAVQEDWMIPQEQYDLLPTYYIYGGVVFVPLTKNLLQAWGSGWYNNAPKDWVGLLSKNFVSADRDQIVVALKVLAADVNEGYHDYRNWAVKQVNGAPIRNLKDLISRVESNKGDYVVFENDIGQELVIQRSAAEASEAEILDRYRIPEDRSEDLRTPDTSN
jgi:S1-C subfamily serine protease